MILRCTFEELSALRGGAELALRAPVWAGHVAAPPEGLGRVEALLPRLTGDISLETLAELREVKGGVEVVLEHLRDRMDSTILAQYVGAEDAVNAYFDFANVLTVSERLREMAAEMRAMVELITGAPPTPETAHQVTFPD